MSDGRRYPLRRADKKRLRARAKALYSRYTTMRLCLLMLLAALFTMAAMVKL